MDMFDQHLNHTTARRQFLCETATGLGAIALADLLIREPVTYGAETGILNRLSHRARAQRCIHIFSPGGVSQVDTFDYKPELSIQDGKKMTGKGKIDPFFGKIGVLRKSYYAFRQHGQSGSWVSSLFPHLSSCVDDLTFFHTLVTRSSSHTPACFQMNTGSTMNGFPSLGAWLSYGLGTVNHQLPSFVVLPDYRGLPNGGSNNWTQGFLPAQHQGTSFSADSDQGSLPNLRTPSSVTTSQRRASLDLLRQFNSDFSDRNLGTSELSARVRSYELAAQMQISVPEATEFGDETENTLSMYGIDNPAISRSAQNYLLGRRLLERGVRFVQIYNGGALGSPRINWDAHEDVKRNHSNQAIHLDQPCAALIQDLKQRGMLEDTLVVWTSEFGRTPFTQGDSSLGRDHHPLTFTGWMAGAGLKPGYHHGTSDELGYQPADNPVSIYDFHATILHLLGIDHEQLTYYHNGLNRRLTDVHGKVVLEVLA